MAEVIIIGSGPAGCSAALYLVRAGHDVHLLSRDGGALARAERIENYYGFPEGISGPELHARGLEAALSLGARHTACEVLGLSFGERLCVSTDRGEHCADALILAPGTARKAAPIPNLAAYEGSGVSYCAVCDGFLHRGRDVLVLGSGAYALHEAEALLGLCSSVTLLTNGQEPEIVMPEGVRIEQTPVAELVGEGRLSGVRLADGRSLSASCLFIALGVAGATDLAKKLGVICEGAYIAADGDGATNVPGVFAAGDCIGGLLQVSKAVADGARAATAAIRYLKRQKT